MPLQNWVIVISWAAFILYWAVSSFNVKKEAGPKPWYWSGPGFFIRSLFAVVLIAIAVSRGRTLNRAGAMDILLSAQHPVLATAGAALVILGIALAVWARVHLGRNWSGYPSLKQGHELVTSGPYRLIRHPIYTGILAAVLGSALATDIVWIIMFALLSALFVRRVFKEEAIMTRQFPDHYPAYKKRTWALVPYVW